MLCRNGGAGQSQIEQDAAVFQQYGGGLVIQKSLQLQCKLVWVGLVYHPIRSRNAVIWAV